MPYRRSLFVLPVLLTLVTLAAAGCGSSKNTATSAGATSRTTSTPATTGSSAATTVTTAASTGPATVSTGSTGIGTVLVNSAGHTLYHFDKDTASSFACSGGCLMAWPPLTLSSGSPVAGAGVSGTLGVRARPDGTQQVTWNGLPLYTFAADTAPGQTKGDGLAGLWHAAKASAAAAGGPVTTAATGGYSY
jgi:predicted lipoprotein with Yx(FWY)xxD motif